MPQQILLQISRQAGIGDETACATVFELLSASRAVQQSLDQLLGPNDLTSSKLATLVTLYALDPLSSTPADLAYHAQVTRSAMTDILDTLQRRGWVARERRTDDRRITSIRMTPRGREATGPQIRKFLQAATRIGSAVTNEQSAALRLGLRGLIAHTQAQPLRF